MNFINFCLLIIYIYLTVKYNKKLKDTYERLKDNEIDYSEIKLQQKRQECFINDLNNEIKKLKDLHN